MEIQYHKRFEKRFRKLPPKIQKKTIQTITLFARDPLHPKLRNHSLSGRLSGLRAISVTGDICIIFEERRNYVLVILIDIGTHNQVYT